MIPKKLRQGDEIRVIAPSRSLGIVSADNRDRATRRLVSLGFGVSFGKRVNEADQFRSTSIEARVADLHDAFRDKKVAAILTVIGGFNSNQLLEHLDYELIRRNPKIFCGYSDITALQNAILKKSGLVTYSGPHFSTFAMHQGLEYTVDHFWKCLVGKAAYEIAWSDLWSDDPWYRDQTNRAFEKNPGPMAIQPGKVEGKIIGGNLCTLNLLQGTEYMPSLRDALIFVEEDEQAGPTSAVEFDRNLQSLLQLPSAKQSKGLVIGRFQRASEMTPEIVTNIIANKRELKGKPVIYGVDFGHTSPMITFPIGGKARLEVSKATIRLSLLAH